MQKLIAFSVRNKLLILLFTFGILGYGVYALTHLPIGAVPDITNNQVQVITTSRNLSTEDVEKYLTYPVELEMANLPNVKEIRSVSKFGLSVVTVVFDDEIGTYLPRQLIAEKIKSAQEKIPEGFGSPFMGPVTTGLGEIYQYTLEIDNAHKGEYTTRDLRSIQDWIVKRQLSGIPGVVEVNTWGGYLKQYEVSIKPELLNSKGISVSEVYEALQRNNSVAGGGYIEKGYESIFIRGEGLVTNLQEIEEIVVTNRNGFPVLIRDIAEVGYGNANRFGAITGNGEGEKVMGQVMMLKGADGKAVIEAVNQRVDEIQASLPPGISINPFLERSELIGKTTFTIAENLILGCLIVIFVVVLLLGNWRSGLVVASVIPICLSFALGLMHIFKVDANLMSLGAIDFGIIIDGAVIIVEFIAFQLTKDTAQILALNKSERQEKVDEVTIASTNKMMNSAIFGQIIIIIVFIPILSLTGVEGKMFIPMALVFCFALIGAMLLCFTYVPAITALVVKPKKQKKLPLTLKALKWLENVYEKALTGVLKIKALVLGLASALLIIAVFLFFRMGGEFVPTLDEGDLVIQPVLKTGTSLEETVKITTKIEKILLKFPEVDQVVSRIGAAEIPTDPMSMEESDVIIKLHPKNTWKTAATKDDLVEAIKDSLQVIPGVGYEFTQPIEMRFNELITGVRADIAIKIFGEDLDELYRLATAVESEIKNVEGASDIIVEKTVGLPQYLVTYNRSNIAKYGVNIEELNTILTTGLGGSTAGVIFEGEKQFDLVLRYPQELRKDLDAFLLTRIKTASGSMVPIQEFAEVSYTQGPAKISRDNTKRRIVVGVNVRNRDLESVVQDIQKIVQEKVALPTGYTVEYGGQFENLRSAKSRLAIAVPVALVLIFMLLYFAFKSVKEALMIYTAIPLAAVGGVLLLFVRDMPFSISAGVGFIALFGIAVLNGIVLIEEFNHLKHEGMQNVVERVLKGTKSRLRPVLLTASAAALGFLPMAISHNAGAEVQRPLATVVIGGLITSTLLTLFVLPTIYVLFEKRKTRVKKELGILIALIGFTSLNARAQETISLPEAISIAHQNNRLLKAAVKDREGTEALEKTAFNPGNTSVYFNYDQNNIAPNDIPLQVWGIEQGFRFPTKFWVEKSQLKAGSKLMKSAENQISFEVDKAVSMAYFEIIYWKSLSAQYTYLDSLFEVLSNNTTIKYEAGEGNYLELLTIQNEHNQVLLSKNQAEEQSKIALLSFNQLLQSDTIYSVNLSGKELLILQPLDTIQHPYLSYLKNEQELMRTTMMTRKQEYIPDIGLGFFQGRNNGTAPNQYYGVQVSLSIPLFFGANKASVNSQKIMISGQEFRLEQAQINLATAYEQELHQLAVYQSQLNFYENGGLKNAKQIEELALAAYVDGEINFSEYVLLMKQAQAIQLKYIETMFLYNQTVIHANYIML